MAHTVVDHKAAALVHLKRYVQWTVEPQLSADDLSAILDNVQTASVWTINTAYVFGAVVEPVTRNGRRYRCIEPGTSAVLLADEPTWPTTHGGTVTDGASDPKLQWQECGPDKESVFDLRAAIHEAWMTKAAKATELFTAGEEEMQQVFEQCEKMAEKFLPVVVA